MGNTLCESEVQGGNVVAHVVVFYYATVFMKSKKKLTPRKTHIPQVTPHYACYSSLLDHAHHRYYSHILMDYTDIELQNVMEVANKRAVYKDSTSIALYKGIHACRCVHACYALMLRLLAFGEYDWNSTNMRGHTKL